MVLQLGLGRPAAGEGPDLQEADRGGRGDRGSQPRQVQANPGNRKKSDCSLK